MAVVLITMVVMMMVVVIVLLLVVLLAVVLNPLTIASISATFEKSLASTPLAGRSRDLFDLYVKKIVNVSSLDVYFTICRPYRNSALPSLNAERR